jgi:hypothetical protein
VTWGVSLEVRSAHSTWAVAMCVNPMTPLQDGSHRAVYVQAALVLLDVQTAHAPKQLNLHTLTNWPGHGCDELERCRWSSRGRSADKNPDPAILVLLHVHNWRVPGGACAGSSSAVSSESGPPSG